MSKMEYIRKYYGVPAKMHGKVKCSGKLGTIKGVKGPHLKIVLDGETHTGNYHPTWEMEYLVNGEWLCV